MGQGLPIRVRRTNTSTLKSLSSLSPQRSLTSSILWEGGCLLKGLREFPVYNLTISLKHQYLNFSTLSDTESCNRARPTPSCPGVCLTLKGRPLLHQMPLSDLKIGRRPPGLEALSHTPPWGEHEKSRKNLERGQEFHRLEQQPGAAAWKVAFWHTSSPPPISHTHHGKNPSPDSQLLMLL